MFALETCCTFLTLQDTFPLYNLYSLLWDICSMSHVLSQNTTKRASGEMVYPTQMLIKKWNF